MIKLGLMAATLCLVLNSITAQVLPQDHVDRGFTAHRVIPKGNYLGFKKLVHDINVGANNFNLDYGFFRAEKSGMHFFSFQMMSTFHEHFRVSLRVNGIPVAWAQAQRKYNQAGTSATLLLNKGDVVYLFLEEGAVFEPAESYRGYGSFTGHRLTYDETEVVVPRILANRYTKEEKAQFDDFKTGLPSNWK